MSLLLTDELASRRRDEDGYYEHSGLQSEAERRMYDIASKACQNPDIEIHTNVHLFDLFESDTILKVPSNGANNDIIINIEVDGTHHKREKKITFCERKDKYSKSKGISVARISTLNEIKDIELEGWVSHSNYFTC